MDIKYVKEIMRQALEESGIYIDISSEEDIDLTNFIESSIQYISIIVNIEELLDAEVPDELLLYDNFKTFNNVCEILADYLASKEFNIPVLS